ncbi:ribosomal-processing cysteine protease Prp [Eubacterium sp. AF34-35BH]|uniref:ribosomal-processing cysteine protease Prp n=1 Tax=Eubacterium sp. AF34-35BH TaxID=2293107 RepID=UPI000E4B81F5|nr:ribosomal-processing cysteine protease Prp [Eubacterium sp. AF34-35BH]RHP23618.1 ribosomal-processing cysteine protease Prp [Eubacterium sp. AF34-35BH]
MIKAKLTENMLQVKGHAGYDKPGKDIVCAAVSILIFTFCEVNKTDIEVKTYTDDEITVEFDSEVNTDYVRTGLGFLENEYPNNVNVSIEP